MPNWIEGTFRARGEKENVKKFLVEGLDAAGFFDDVPQISKEIVDYEDGFCVYYHTDKNKDAEGMHLKGARRHFLEETQFGLSAFKKANGEYQITSSFKAAWRIDVHTIKAISKEFNVDIRVNGFECGMQFEQLIEVKRDGSVRSDSTIQYDDYDWQCSMPLLGG